MWELVTVIVSAFGYLGMGWLAWRQDKRAETRRLDDRKHEGQLAHASLVRSLRQRHLAAIEQYADFLMTQSSRIEVSATAGKRIPLYINDEEETKHLWNISLFTSQAIAAVMALDEVDRLSVPVLALNTLSAEVFEAYPPRGEKRDQKVLDNFLSKRASLIVGVANVRRILIEVEAGPTPNP